MNYSPTLNESDIEVMLVFFRCVTFSLKGKHYVQNCILKKKLNIILKTRYIIIYLSFH